MFNPSFSPFTTIQSLYILANPRSFSLQSLQLEAYCSPPLPTLLHLISQREDHSQFSKNKGLDSALSSLTKCIAMTKRRETSATKQEEEEERNWIDLPRDVLLLIFKKLDVVQILDSAQWVCRWWQQVSKDPRFYHSVDIQDATRCLHYPQVRMLAKEVVDRSCGQLVEFHCYEFMDAEDVYYFLNYLVDQNHALKSLGLGCKTTTPPTTTPTIDIGQFIERLPLLEELNLEMELYNYTGKLIETIYSSGRTIKLRFFRGELYRR